MPSDTGRTEQDKYNNIYDMLGNVSEWTTETCTKGKVERGGSSYSSSHGNGGYASLRDYTNYYSSSWYIGFRTQIYLK